MQMLQDLSDRKVSADELEADIDSEKAKLEINHGGSEAMVKEFEKRAKDIEGLKARVQEFQKGLHELEHAIKEIREKWEPPLDELVARISDKFGQSFRRIGCRSEER